LKFVILLLAVGVTTASIAPSSPLPKGIWANMEFVETLKRTHNVDSALTALGPTSPIIMVTNTDVQCVRDGSPSLATVVTNPTKGLGAQVRVTWSGITWIAAADDKSGEYIALHRSDNIEAKPIVFGKMPSKNTDVSFVLSRILNSALLTGVYIDGKGQQYLFSPAQSAGWKDDVFSYDVELDWRARRAVLRKKGTTATWSVHRSGDTLSLSALAKNGSPLRRPPLRLVRTADKP